MSTWHWVGSRLGREALQSVVTHLSLILEVSKSSLEFFKCFKENDLSGVQKYFSEIFNYEREADNVKRRILEELSKGFIHPIDRDEIVRLVLVADDIAAYIKAATRRATLVDPKLIDYEIKFYAIVMCEKVLQAIQLLREAVMVLHSEPNKALSIANDIERIEEEVDEIRLKALSKVLKFCDQSEMSTCIVSKEIIDSLENSADRCEDSADVVRVIAVLRI